MKAFIAILFLTFSVAYSQDMRNVTWGDSRSTVKSLESNSILTETADYVAYSSIIAGLSVWVVYDFIEDKCARIRIIIVEKHANPTMFIQDYKRLKSLLTNLYGNPIEDDTIWLNSQYKNDPSNYGMAVSKGDLMYVTEFSTERTTILLELLGDNYSVDHFVIHYLSKELFVREDPSSGL